MAKKLYVGNLSYHTTDDTLRHAFSVFGEITSCTVVIDRYTNSSKGFGFVEMSTEQAAEAALSGMNGQTLDGRQLRVSEANDKPRGDRPSYGNRW
jgi:RNA recognition motif-containing protein